MAIVPDFSPASNGTKIAQIRSAVSSL